MPSPSRAARHLAGRMLLATTTFATAAGAWLMAAPRPAAADPVSEASAIVYDINAIRAWFHLPGLAMNPALSNFAVAHSEQMAAARTVFHSSSLWSVAAVVPGWSAVGENVGMGPNEPAVAYALARSITHLRNMLGAYDKVGVGVVDSGGWVYVTEEFAQAPG